MLKITIVIMLFFKMIESLDSLFSSIFTWVLSLVKPCLREKLVKNLK